MFRRVTCFALLLLFFLLGCRAADRKESELPANTAVVTPIPTAPALPTRPVPTPAVGRGTIYGQILHNDRSPAARITVLFCQNFSLSGGCPNDGYSVTTNADGTYIVTEVMPGFYSLAIYPQGTGNMPVQYASEMALRAQQFEVERNERLTIEPIVLFANDLQVLVPGETVFLPKNVNASDIARPVEFRWQPYPGAVRYEISLAPERGGAIWVNEAVKADRITAVLPRLYCHYYWQVSAYDSVDVKIASSPNMTFTLQTAEEPSCHLTLFEPQAGAVLTSTGQIVLDWEVQATAVRYRLWLADEDHPQRPPVLDFVEVERSRYEFPEGMAISHYIWKVTAYDENGRMIAESDVSEFEVIP